MTLDNTSANNVAIEIMHPLVSEYHEELFHQRCTCHIVNLKVKDGLNLVHEPIKKISHLNPYFNAKSTRVQSFKQYYKHDMPRAKTSGLDQPHRLNSTYMM